MTETLNDLRFTPERFDLLLDFFGQIVARIVAECDVGAFARKHLTQRRANAARAAGNECSFSFE